MTNSTHESPPWPRNFKLIVTVCLLIIAVVMLFQFRAIVSYLVYAAILAYLINPLVNILVSRTPLKRTHAILLLYLALLGFLITGAISIGVAGYTQINTLIEQFPTIVAQVTDWISALTAKPITFGRFSIPLDQINWDQLQTEFVALVNESSSALVQRGSSVVGGFAQVTYSTIASIGTLFLIFIMAIYVSFDIPHLGEVVGGFAQLPGYRADADRLFRDFGRIWRAYLRGQIILALAMWAIVWITLSILGVQNAFALGLLSGVMEFLPVVGAFLGAVAAVVVAVLQATNWIGLDAFQYGLLIAVVMIIIQQIENNLLVPRIVGKALDLHPLVTMIVVIMGVSIAGILGAVLAAPLAATIKLLVAYIWHKLFDHHPFPEPEAENNDEKSWLVRIRELVQTRIGEMDATD